MRKTIEERIHDGLDKSGGPDGCWPWVKGRHRQGYGQIKINRRTMTTHRIAWMLVNGEIPIGKMICHSCDNPPCCNPKHLWLGTGKENLSDAARKGRMANGDRHGLRLHPELRKSCPGNLNGSRKHPERLRRGETHGRAKLSNDQVLKIAERLRGGEFEILIAKEFSVSIQTINNISTGRKWSSVTGIKRRYGYAIGENVGNSKLKANQVMKIFGRSNQSQESIAKEFGISRRAVGMIKQGKIWSHVTGPQFFRKAR